MPEGGRDLAAPPVRVWAGVSRALFTTLVSGSNYYSMGAGGFSTVPAIPRLLTLQQPANPNTAQQVRAAQIYAQNQLPIKQQIKRRFQVS